MKKEYVKPTLLVLATEPSQIMATSPGEGGENIGWGPEGEGTPDGNENEDDAGDDGSFSKGGLWDEFTW